MFATVQEMNPSRSGNSQRLKLQGKWYVAGNRVNLDGIAKGQYVEYETSSFPGNDGQMIASIARIRPAAQQGNYNAAAGSTGTPQAPSTIMDGDILRSVSNIVGNAAAAGKIGSPTDIHDWVDMAYHALVSMGKAQAPTGGSQQNPGSAPKDEEPPPFDDSDVTW